MSEMIRLDAIERMQKTIKALKGEFVKIRTGRAHSSLLEHITVPYYGTNVPINQVANVTVLDTRTLGVVPYEKNIVSIVEKSIRDSDLGLNPTNVGDLLRIPLPAMTEERRRDLVKVVRNEAESTRIAVRNIRRDANHDLKALMNDKDISKDEEHHAGEVIQKLTNKFIAEVDTVLADKETELMEV
ncbi:ribosome recycling factor [Candidatus Parabeggiatoa sp. HSG14]|uniref:ribosome recycling factor n=1 Tax=Candidatus Parabeggiatoa sp. HSG14 TaxID=3055593 RepID=UPI0025A7AB4C|nr:ribosome recycling factor [Thiotrichales bacterium HSG14]